MKYYDTSATKQQYTCTSNTRCSNYITTTSSTKDEDENPTKCLSKRLGDQLLFFSLLQVHELKSERIY